MATKKAIFIDFDGVLRHWCSGKIDLAEKECSLEPGSLFSIAFTDDYLNPAITGKISHETWLAQVHEALTGLYDKAIASRLVAAWEEAEWEFDSGFLDGIKEIAPECQIILTTNATSKLQSDLESSGLDLVFDKVVNSFEIGIAKPATGYFTRALSLANTSEKNTLYIDDSLGNIEVATLLGIKSKHHTSVSSTLEFIRSECTEAR